MVEVLEETMEPAFRTPSSFPYTSCLMSNRSTTGGAVGHQTGRIREAGGGTESGFHSLLQHLHHTPARSGGGTAGDLCPRFPDHSLFQPAALHAASGGCGRRED